MLEKNPDVNNYWDVHLSKNVYFDQEECQLVITAVRGNVKEFVVEKLLENKQCAMRMMRGTNVWKYKFWANMEKGGSRGATMNSEYPMIMIIATILINIVLVFLERNTSLTIQNSW